MSNLLNYRAARDYRAPAFNAALKTHPDRIPSDHPDRAARTRKFQLVNDAYYTLSDATRRRDYDAQRNLFPGGGPSPSSDGPSPQMPGGFQPGADPFADANAGAGAAAGMAGSAFSWAWNFFAGRKDGGAGSAGAGGEPERARAENEQFADVFEEMLREEGMAGDDARPTGKFWSVLGGASGGALGFIVANVPGLVAGAVAGNRLGAVRDSKGKSVYAVFQELPQDDRARLLSRLAARVLSGAVGI
ncbi:hypothetical protein BT67DRAFT_463947 [Trichocladium antarcticum]|uniref:J domain-containing protein n=1 Tax=Trichocladium antarcticum TaxID=1450529 RepID=A0AAN6UG14_9PEZI|nr:hypothetical protein BT67DRAFT_463947 [Trichocladium antarcticum]